MAGFAARVSALACCLAVMLGAVPSVQATCLPVRSALPVVDPSRPLAERVATLQARAFWIDDGSEVPAWRAILAEIDHQPAPDREMEASAHAELAAALADDASNDEQLAQAKTAQAIAQKYGLTDRDSYSRILTQLIYKLVRSGKLVEADSYAQPLLTSARRHFGEHSLEWAVAQSATGWVAYNSGRYEESLQSAAVKRDVLSECLPPDDHRIADAITGHSASLSSLGRIDEALAEAFVGARRASDTLADDHPSQIYTLRNLGIQLGIVDRWPEAEAVLTRAVTLQARYHSADAQGRALTLSALARSVDEQGRHLEAEALWSRALALYAGVKERSSGFGTAVILRRSADAAEQRGDLATALMRRNAALAGLSLPPDNLNRAAVVLELAQTLALNGRAREAKEVGAPAFAIVAAKSPADDPRLILSTAQWAQVVTAADGAQAGKAALAPATARMQALLLDPAASRSDLAAFASIFTSGMMFEARLSLETGHDAEGFRAMQLAALSQIVLATTDAMARDAAQNPQERVLVSQLQDSVLHRRLLERERSAAIGDSKSSLATQSGATPVEANAIDASIVDIDQTIVRLTAEIDQRFPQYRQRSRPTPISLEAFRASLRPDEVLWAPITLATGTIVVAITRDRLQWAKTAATSVTIAQLTRRIRVSVTAQRAAFDIAAARQLYASVVPPGLRAVLAAHRSLLWYAHGSLASIPPALLVAPTNGRAIAWLIRSHAITVVPSLSLLARSASHGQGKVSFLGVGAPRLANGEAAPTDRLAFRNATIEMRSLGSLPPLPGAARELYAMQALLGPGGQVLVGSNATEAALRALPLAGFNVLAFATHGLNAGDIGGLIEPALVLTPEAGGTPTGDGLLTASEIAELRLDADWVILSACDTASGGEGGLPEYSGLASAFVRAGAHALLVSHWPVRDDAAAILTVDTLRQARTAPSRAIALQQAQLKLMANRRVPGSANPAIWAPFVLVGR